MMKYLIQIIFAMAAFSCDSIYLKHDTNIALFQKYVHSVKEMGFNTMDQLPAEKYMGYGPSSNDSIGNDQALKSQLNGRLC